MNNNLYVAIIIVASIIMLSIAIKSFLPMTVAYPMAVAYCIAINIVMFCAMWWDKYQSQQRKIFQWRIKNEFFFAVSALGGALGGILGMYIFRHKTLNKTYKLAFTAFLLCHVMVLWFILSHYPR